MISLSLTRKDRKLKPRPVKRLLLARSVLCERDNHLAFSVLRAAFPIKSIAVDDVTVKAPDLFYSEWSVPRL